MEEEKLNNAILRATKVIEGLTQVKEQQARDVINLSKHIKEQMKTIKILINKVAELEGKVKSSKAYPFGTGMW